MSDKDNECKKDEEVLAEMYRNCQIGIQSISDIICETDDELIKKELAFEHEQYEQMSGKIATLIKTYDSEVKEVGAFKKAMMKGSIKMNTLTDDSTSHIAQMMIQGTVMGSISLMATFANSKNCLAPETLDLLKELIDLEEGFEKKLKEFL